MKSDPTLAQQHPILRSCAAIDAALKEVSDVDPVFMTTADKAVALLTLQAEQDRIGELKLRVLGTAADVADEAGSRSPGAWLALRGRVWMPVGRREEKLAAALAAHEQVRAAVASGEASLDQAQEIVAALAALPAELDEGLIWKAESVLVSYCAEFGPKQLRRLGTRLLDVLAPEIADAAEERWLRRLEREARARTRLTMASQGDGTTKISAVVPDATAALFKAQLHTFTSPRRDRAGEQERDPASGERLAYDEQLGRAFCSLLEHVPVDRLPRHGNTTVSVVATIELDKLLAGVGGGTLSSGEPISAGEARRLACQTGVIPAVLGTKSEVHDLGRRARLFTAGQRKALAIRDRECRAEGCDIPAAWCEAHHRQPWSTGGRTDLADGVLLCSRHHHLVNDDHYDTSWLPNGDVRFHRRR